MAFIVLFLALEESNWSFVFEFTKPAEADICGETLKEPLMEISEVFRLCEKPVLSAKALLWKDPVRLWTPSGCSTEKLIVVVLLFCTVAGWPSAVLDIYEAVSMVPLNTLVVLERLACVWRVVVLAGSFARLSV